VREANPDIPFPWEGPNGLPCVGGKQSFIEGINGARDNPGVWFVDGHPQTVRFPRRPTANYFQA
jgi:hypothetical protein